MNITRMSDQEKSKILGDSLDKGITPEFKGKKEKVSHKKLDSINDFSIFNNKVDRANSLKNCEFQDGDSFTTQGKSKMGHSIWGKGEINRDYEQVEEKINKKEAEIEKEKQEKIAKLEEQEIKEAEQAIVDMKKNNRLFVSDSDNLNRISDSSVFSEKEEPALSKVAQNDQVILKKDVKKVKDRSWENSGKSKSIDEIFNNRLESFPT